MKSNPIKILNGQTFATSEQNIQDYKSIMILFVRVVNYYTNTSMPDGLKNQLTILVYYLTLSKLPR